MIDIITLVKECPEATITVKAKDLVQANSQLVDEVRKMIESTKIENEDSSLRTRNEVMKELNISSPTLWRWERAGYLVPVSFGGLKRYKATDVRSIKEGKRL